MMVEWPDPRGTIVSSSNGTQPSFAGRFKIGARIFAGFGLILVLLGGLVWLGYDGLEKAQDGLKDYARISNNTIFVVGIARTAEQLRRQVVNYSATGDEATLKLVTGISDQLREQLEQFGSRTRNPPRKKLTADLKQLFETYMRGFQDLVAARQGLDRLVERKLNPTGADIRTKYSEIMRRAMADGNTAEAAQTGLTLEALMLARIQVLRFLVTPDDKIATEAQTRMATYERSGKELATKLQDPARRKLAEEASVLLSTYVEAFAEVRKTAGALEALVRKTLPEIGNTFGRVADQLRESQMGLNTAPDHYVGSQKSAEEKTDAQVEAIQDTSLEFGLGALVLGMVLAWLIARSITRPVASMTGAMTRLADGDLAVSVPALADRDEIGDMAKAVQVFKENAVEKVRMDEAEQKRLEAERKAAEAQRAREAVIGQEIAALIDAVSKGDLSSRIDLAGKDGFYKTMSEGINRLTDTVQGAIADIARVLGALAEGDLNQRISKDYHGAFDQLKTDVNATSAKLGEIVGQISEATEAISQASAEVSSGSADLAERTEQQASSLEETAAAMEEMGATVRSNADNATSANQMAISTKGAAEQGGVLAGSAIEAMKRIEQSARKITDIIGVIDEIAFQTNLLALNAAVEAARAGDAGKGFAVVAQEVRILAQRSAQASKEIKALILASDNEVRDGVEMVKKAGAALGGIAEGVNKVAAVIADIATASSEQATALEEINAAVAGLDEMTQKNAALVEETTAAAQAMSGQASDLRQQMAFFKLARSTDSRGAATARKAARGGHGQTGGSALIRWSPDMSVGVAVFDQDHQHLIDLVNTIYDGLRQGQGKEALGRILDELIEYTVQHFGREEAAFKRSGYPAYWPHKEQHEKLKKEVVRLRKQYQDNFSAKLGMEVIQFLKNWLLTHIMETDKRYGHHLNSHGVH